MNEERIEMNESVGVKKDVDTSARQEYVDSFFSLIPEAMNYMTSQNLQLAINSLEKALKKVKREEEEEKEIDFFLYSHNIIIGLVLCHFVPF